MYVTIADNLICVSEQQPCSRLLTVNLPIRWLKSDCLSHAIRTLFTCGSPILKSIAASADKHHGGGLFPPQDPEREQALEYLHRSPHLFGAERSRWSLAGLKEHCPVFKALRSLGGICRRLIRWKIARKAGRLHITSPDPDYDPKLKAIGATFEQANQPNADMAVLYADEFTFYRQPTLGPCYHEQGKDSKSQPLAQWTGGAKTKHRVVAALNALTGAVVSGFGSVIGIKALCQFMHTVREFYGPDKRIVLIWDNWPIHKHEAVLNAAADNKIEILFVPTYAPWTNPIEKLWRKLKQEMICMHAYHDKTQWPQLCQRVKEFMERLQTPSQETLNYVGLAS
jgi:putative transposase